MKRVILKISVSLLVFAGIIAAYFLSIYEKNNYEQPVMQSATLPIINMVYQNTNINMLQGYTGMKEAYEKYESVEDDRNRLIGAVMVQNTVILEILYAVFVHNKNLPQGVKDLVVLQYANGQKSLGDDEVLRAIVESVRQKINLNSTADQSFDELTVEEEAVN